MSGQQKSIIKVMQCLSWRIFWRTHKTIFCSRGRPLEQFYWMSSRFQGTSNRNSSGRPVEIFIAFLNEISNSKTFEANLQNSSGRPVESYQTSRRIQWMSNRSSTGRPLDQMIWANIYQFSVGLLYYIQSTRTLPHNPKQYTCIACFR